MRKAALAIMAGLACAPALAEVRIERVEVRPNPAQFAGSTPPQVEIAVTVKRSGPLETGRCEVIIDPGNPGGRQVPRLTFNAGGESTQRTRYIYDRPGTYRLIASSFSGCVGSRTVTVNVRDASGSTGAKGGGAKSGGAAGTTTTAKATKPKCPGGWEVVPQSVQGARYSCSPKPPARPIACEGGTSYFAENNLVGCR
jgi:hypothetical protein